MLVINKNKEPRVEKHLLGFPFADIVLARILPSVAVVPVKTCNLAEVEHKCILA